MKMFLTSERSSDDAREVATPCLQSCQPCIYSDLGLTRHMEIHHGDQEEGKEEGFEKEVSSLPG
jgi:hypothetical protein